MATAYGLLAWLEFRAGGHEALTRQNISSWARPDPPTSKHPCRLEQVKQGHVPTSCGTPADILLETATLSRRISKLWCCTRCRPRRFSGAVHCWVSRASGRLVKSTLLATLRSAATCGNAGPHSGEGKIHGKDGVAGSIPAGGSTPRLTSVCAGQFRVWGPVEWAMLVVLAFGVALGGRMPDGEHFPG